MSGSLMEPCEGVYDPRDGKAHCFIQERDLWGKLSGSTWGTGRRNPFHPTAERFLPGSEGGEYTLSNLRIAHDYCQMVQGGLIAGPKNVESGHIQTLAASNRSKMTHEQLSEYGRRGAAATNGRHYRDRNFGRTVAVKGRCQRWNINRGKPCSCGHHVTEEATT